MIWGVIRMFQDLESITNGLDTLNSSRVYGGHDLIIPVRYRKGSPKKDEAVGEQSSTNIHKLRRLYNINPKGSSFYGMSHSIEVRGKLSLNAFPYYQRHKFIL